MSPKMKASIRDVPLSLHVQVPKLFRTEHTLSWETFLDTLDGLLVFSFVRHPFERCDIGSNLVSCSTYSDRFVSRLISAFEHKVVYSDYKGLRTKTGGNFTKFVDELLDWAEEKKCFGSLAKCTIDVHFRPQVGR